MTGLEPRSNKAHDACNLIASDFKQLGPPIHRWVPKVHGPGAKSLGHGPFGPIFRGPEGRFFRVLFFLRVCLQTEGPGPQGGPGPGPGPGPWPHGPGPIWPRPHIWPWPHMALAPYGPGPLYGPGPIYGPGPWAQGPLIWPMGFILGYFWHHSPLVAHY